jgi:hypothetical protein
MVRALSHGFAIGAIGARCDRPGLTVIEVAALACFVSDQWRGVTASARSPPSRAAWSSA